MFSIHAFALVAALSGAGETVLLEFQADWCGPCQSMQPTVDRLVTAGYPVRKVDVDQQRQLASQYRVRNVPCFIMVQNGQEVDRVVGATSHARLLRMFETAGVTPAEAKTPQVRAQSPDYTPGSVPPPGAPSAQAGAPPTRPEGGNPLSAQQRAMYATVRLKVEDPQGHSYGTGTIIDTYGEEALVVTCGHVFRDSRGQGRISVDLFAPGANGPVRGQLIGYDADERDIAVVSIRPGVEIAPVQVAPASYHAGQGDRVFSIGCDRGADPSVRESRVTAVNKYVGAPNIEVAGQPVDGRSGGGLFSSEGLLIGICNAADPRDDEGIYAGLATIHWQLDQIGQQRIYERGESLLAQTRQTAPRHAETNLGEVQTPAMPQQMPNSADADPGQQALLQTNGSEDAEIICIVRSRNNPHGKNEVIVLDQPSRELLARLTEESRHRRPLSPAAQASLREAGARGGQATEGHAPVTREAALRSEHGRSDLAAWPAAERPWPGQPQRNEHPVVRGQSNR